MCMLYFTNGFAQNYWFKNVGLAEGLSSSKVNSICKDRYGFVWFGSSAGLNRYDGVSIRQFVASNQVNSLPDSYIESVQESYDGLIWIKTNGGYVVLDPVTLNFDQSVSQHLAMIAANLDPEVIYFDKRKNVWIFDKNQAVYYYKYKQQLVYALNFGDEKSGLPEGDISDFCDTSEGVLVVYRNGRVACINGEQQKVLWINDVIAKNTSLQDDYRIFTDKEGNIYVYGEAHSYVYDKNASHWFTSLAEMNAAWGGESSLGNELITDVCMSSKGEVWVATDRCGLLCINPTEHRVVKHINAGGDRGLISNNLETVYMDDTDLLWVGTSRSGVSYYAPNIYMFDVAHIGDVYSISEDSKGTFWLATNGNGLVYKNMKDGFTASYTTTDGLNDNMLSCVLSASDGTVWAGSNRFGLNRLNSKGITVFKSTPGNEKGLLDNNVQALAEDRFNNIWIGTRKGGLQCINAKTGAISNFNTRNQKLQNNNVTSLHCNGTQLVTGTMNGIMVLNLSSNKTTNYNGTISGDKHFTSNAVTQVYTDSRGLIWVGTRDGLNVLDVVMDELTTFDTNNGLPSNVICGITEDKDNAIWITTSRGACRIDIQKSTTNDARFAFNFYRYDVTDGLQGVEFNMGAILSTRSGRIIMGGQNGINWIRNNTSTSHKRNLQVLLSRLSIDGQPIGVGVNYNGRVILPKLLNSIEKLKLKSSDQNINILLGINDYNHAEHPRYIYQVEGLNEMWQPVSGDGNTLSLAYLPRGSYILRVKAMLDNGKTISEEHVLKIIVYGPWYTQWWALVIAVLVIALVIFAIFRLWPFVIGYYQQRQRELMNLQKRQSEMYTISQELRSNVVSMIPQLGLLMLDPKNAEQKETLIGLHHAARQMLVSLNQLKEDKFVMVNDEGIDSGSLTVTNDDDNVLIGDEGVVSDESAGKSDFLISDDGIIGSDGTLTSLVRKNEYTLFLVEPDKDMLEFVADCLKSTYNVVPFTNTMACWDAIHETRPNVVMCAENMPEMSGSELCERLKNERSFERIPYILTTDGVLSQSEVVIKKLSLIADDYIPSPYNLQSVILRINNLLGEPNTGDTVMDDTLRGAIANCNSVKAQLKSVVDQYIKENISRKDLSFEELCHVMNISRTLLFRKVESITGFSPTDYIRHTRLVEAAKLLESGYVSPAEVAQELGFANLAMFSRFFQSEYGVLPSQYADGERKV